MMDKLIAEFPEQLTKAMEIGAKAELTPIPQKPSHLVVSGLGGSGIGGDLLRTFVQNKLDFPIIVNKDYELPKFVGPASLVFISSYSGNTEETYHAFQEAEEKGAKIVCITSNGKILEAAQQKEFDHIVIPGGMPPRACMGYSVVQQLYILHHLSEIGNDFKQPLQKAIQRLKDEQNDIKEQTKKLAEELKDKYPVIYITEEMEAVGVRFRQQFNENAKQLCWHHVIPEMNHNELVGWRQKDNDLHVLFLRNKTDRQRIQQRIEINKSIIQKYTAHITEIHSKGDSLIERAFYLIHYGDWLSYYLALEKGVDPMEVDVIDFLKEELAKKPLSI